SFSFAKATKAILFPSRDQTGSKSRASPRLTFITLDPSRSAAKMCHLALPSRLEAKRSFFGAELWALTVDCGPRDSKVARSEPDERKKSRIACSTLRLSSGGRAQSHELTKNQHTPAPPGCWPAAAYAASADSRSRKSPRSLRQGARAESVAEAGRHHSL